MQRRRVSPALSCITLVMQFEPDGQQFHWRHPERSRFSGGARDLARIVTVLSNLHHNTGMPNSPANGTSRHL
jgi:hypothetical protein